jgi:pseudouridine-5'-phosphate glycosidase/pseudouridine kinase
MLTQMLAPRAVLRVGCLRATQLSRARKYHDFAQSKFFQVSEEVRDAVATGKPVVSLETTIYTHGEFFLSSFLGH